MDIYLPTKGVPPQGILAVMVVKWKTLVNAVTVGMICAIRSGQNGVGDDDHEGRGGP